MKRAFLFICIGLLAATTASAQNPPAQSGPNNAVSTAPVKTTPTLLSLVAIVSLKDKPNRRSRKRATPTSPN